MKFFTSSLPAMRRAKPGWQVSIPTPTTSYRLRVISLIINSKVWSDPDSISYQVTQKSTSAWINIIITNTSHN